MPKLSKKAVDRIGAGIKRFQPILASAKAREVNASDTVIIVTDLLQEIFGYDKFTEITSAHMIRGSFCDLAIKLDGTLAVLIEVKAIALDLKEQYVKAVDYAANQACEWVTLTNGIVWKVYKVCFSKPIEHEFVVELDLLTVNPRSSDHIDLIGLLAKEGWEKAHLGEYHTQRRALGLTLGALIRSDPVLEILRREVRRLSPDVRMECEDIRSVLESEVLKREVLESEKAGSARKKVGSGSRADTSNSEQETRNEAAAPTADLPG
ncbi:MAG: restriction endonuclease subunit R [Pyrinomonadaceae bacterium]|nr:restriction endonuclease subunit R [Pyrinomonadaceae bacterium]